jgi:hypothetical protein
MHFAIRKTKSAWNNLHSTKKCDCASHEVTCFKVTAELYGVAMPRVEPRPFQWTWMFFAVLLTSASCDIFTVIGQLRCSYCCILHFFHVITTALQYVCFGTYYFNKWKIFLFISNDYTLPWKKKHCLYSLHCTTYTLPQVSDFFVPVTAFHSVF